MVSLQRAEREPLRKATGEFIENHATLFDCTVLPNLEIDWKSEIEPKPNAKVVDAQWKKFSESLVKYILRLDAVRQVSPDSQPGSQSVLRTDASNLSQLIHELKTVEEDKFREYQELVERVLPFVKEITLPSPSGGKIELRIGTNAPSIRRKRLG